LPAPTGGYVATLRLDRQRMEVLRDGVQPLAECSETLQIAHALNEVQDVFFHQFDFHQQGGRLTLSTGEARWKTGCDRLVL
jgi:hypothetical protein